jgi:hypothetical protein
MQEKGLQIGESLTTALGNELLDSLGLSTFMNDEQCNRYSGVYADAVSGWNYKGNNVIDILVCMLMQSVDGIIEVYLSFIIHVLPLSTGRAVAMSS